MQFDIHKLISPDVQGKEYQRGALYRTTLRAALVHRDGHKCFYCDKSGRKHPMEIDHVIPKASGGTLRIDNAVLACVPCNRRKDDTPVEVFLKRRPAKLKLLKERLRVNVQSAAHLNIIIPNLLKQLRPTGRTITEHDAASTAAARKIFGIEKTEHADAALMGNPLSLTGPVPEPYQVSATGRGGRQRSVPDTNGTPRGKPYREYCKLSPADKKHTPTPGHKSREKRPYGIGHGDFVRLRHKGRSDNRSRHPLQKPGIRQAGGQGEDRLRNESRSAGVRPRIPGDSTHTRIPLVCKHALAQQFGNPE